MVDTTEFINPFAKYHMEGKYAHKVDGRKETWPEVAKRVAFHVFKSVDASSYFVESAETAIARREFIPGGRYLYASGRQFHQTQNCLLLTAEDSREGWAEIMNKATMALMTGAGIGIVYTKVRGERKLIRKTGGQATGPCALMQMVNEAGRYIMQGGNRRSAIWAGLHWNHCDIFKFIRIKNWSPEVKALKEKDFAFPATLDGTNISVILDDAFFKAFHDEDDPMHNHAHSVYWETVRQMMQTAEPGFSIDVGVNAGEHLRNACTEITSSDTDDICNLGSINMARVKSLDHMRHLVEVGTSFLLAGTVYSHLPYSDVDKVRRKNRRLGLGLMGLHEWLIARGKPYGPDAELEEYLKVYAKSTEIAHDFADMWDLTKPVKTRAIAPNGTIGIVAETTTGIEPIFAVAYKRRYQKGKDHTAFQYVIDPTAKRLIAAGANPAKIEDAYSLARDVERRVAFQAWIQQFVDHGISSTINLPEWGSEWNNESRVTQFGEMLMQYLPKLRGITCYPDGARGGQPFSAASYELAKKYEGEEFDETPPDVCDLRGGGSCGA